MVTLAAYFLTCCKPVYKSSFCFKVQNPRFLNFHHYPHEPLEQYSKCNNHQNLRDHCLNAFNSCTDDRVWALDDEQRRHHFLEICSGRIPLCGCDKVDSEEKEAAEISDLTKSVAKVKPSKEKVEKPEEPPLKIKIEEKQEETPTIEVKETPIVEETPTVEVISLLEKPPNEVEIKRDPKIKIKNESLEVDLTPIKGCLGTIEDAEKPLEAETTPKPPPPITKQFSPTTTSTTLLGKDVVLVTDEIMDKLDSNLSNLELTFDKFVKKNRDFIKNLVLIVNFEKNKQKALENNYYKLKQEYDILKSKNQYLMIVNEKQVQLFKNELDKVMSENKAAYRKKMQRMELQMQTDQNTLKYYRKTEQKYLKFVEKETSEVKKLKDDLKNFQVKETKLLKNYVNVLNFLEEMKESLNNCCQSKGFVPQESSDKITACDSNPSLLDVLKSALKHGIKSLNVRDLSILHDAILELNDQLCHQSSFCGRNPLSNVCFSHFSMICTEEYPVNDIMSREFKEYETESNLSFIPSRQRPDGSHVYNC